MNLCKAGELSVKNRYLAADARDIASDNCDQAVPCCDVLYNPRGGFPAGP